MDGSGLDWTDDFQKFADQDWSIFNFFRIRIGLRLKNFTVS